MDLELFVSESQIRWLAKIYCRLSDERKQAQIKIKNEFL